MRSPAVQKFKAGELPISSVTVFNDRAEIIRTVELHLSAGLNEVVIEEFCYKLKEDTIRVDGKGDAVIQEVQYKCKPLQENEYPQERCVLQDKLKNLVAQRKMINERKNVISKRTDALERMAAQNPPNIQYHKENKEDLSVTLYDVDSLGKVSKFFELFEKEYAQLVERKMKLDDELDELRKQESAVQEELRSSFPGGLFARVATVLLDCDSACDEVLELRYQVEGAAWYPSYDIRVTSEVQEEPQLKVVYQGNIKQATGEDWTNTKLILSTADPSDGAAQLQQLHTLNVAILEKTNHTRPIGPFCQFEGRKQIQHAGAVFGSSRSFAANAAPYSANDAWAAQQDLQQSAPLRELPESAVLEATIDAPNETGYSIAAVFNIERRATIPSDSGDHKVTITSFETKPRIVYKTVPRKSPNVFITALAVNQTLFPFLEGNAAIHFSKSFISNIQISRVDPGQKFSCNLGVDPYVTVDYKSARESSSEVGPIAKIARLTHERKIIVHNKKPKEKILLLIQEHLPKSSEDRIQVTLKSPELEVTNQDDQEVKPGARLNASNNIEWTVSLEPSESKELSIEYTIDHPVGTSLRYF